MTVIRSYKIDKTKDVRYNVRDNVHVERGACHGSNHTNEFKKEFI